MSGTCIEKKVHDVCGKKGLQVFAKEDGSVDGFCFICHTYVPNPYSDEDMPDEREIKKKKEDAARKARGELDRINSLGCDDRPERGLKKSTLNRFGIKTENSVIYFPFHDDKGEVTGYKAKLTLENGKNMYWSVGNVTNCVPFGWHQAVAAASYNLYITEGELDAAAIVQVLLNSQRGTKYEGRIPSVISITHGVNSVKKLNPYMRDIRTHWKQVVCAFDMDDAGEKAVKELTLILPSVKRANLPDKDANAALMNGKSKMLMTSLMFSHEKVKNSRLVNIKDLIPKMKEKPTWGYSLPFPKLNQAMRGMRKGETMYVGGGVKMGKGEVCMTIAAHLMNTYNMKVLMADFEDRPWNSGKRLFNKFTGKFFNDPEKEWDDEAFERAAVLVDDNCTYVDKYQTVSWDHLKLDIIQAVEEGAEAIFIDPITNFTNGIPSAEANTLLQSFAQDLSSEAMDKGFLAFIFCHLKAPLQGKPHERGGTINSTDFAGSRAMMRSCNFMVGLQGDRSQYHEIQGRRIERTIEEQNMRELVLLENRAFGEGSADELFWNKETGLFEVV